MKKSFYKNRLLPLLASVKVTQNDSTEEVLDKILKFKPMIESVEYEAIKSFVKTMWNFESKLKKGEEFIFAFQPGFNTIDPTRNESFEFKDPILDMKETVTIKTPEKKFVKHGNMMFTKCSYCGGRLFPMFNFCPHCGIDLSEMYNDNSNNEDNNQNSLVPIELPTINEQELNEEENMENPIDNYINTNESCNKQNTPNLPGLKQPFSTCMRPGCGHQGGGFGKGKGFIASKLNTKISNIIIEDEEVGRINISDLPSKREVSKSIQFKK